jgi:di/tripeptidase
MSQVHSTEEELSVAELKRLVDLLVAVARRAAE